MEKTGKKRNVTLDVAKGLAIVLVVFSHAMITCLGGWESVIHSWYYVAGYHFTIALFMFISGYLAYTKLDFMLIQRRFLQLILPFVAWSIVLYFYSSYINSYYPLRSSVIKTVLYYGWTLDTSGFWFLPVMFGFYVLLYLTRGKLWAILITIVAAYLLSQVSPSLLESLHLPDTAWFSIIAWFMPVFAGGYLVSKYRDRLRSLGFIKWICLVAFPVCFWLGGEMNYGAVSFSWPVYTADGRDVVIGFYRFGMALLGIGMAFAVADLLAKVTVTRRVLKYLGMITLGIYCTHTFFVSVHIGSGIFWIIAMPLTAIALSTAIIWMLHRFSITDFVFLGGVKRLGSFNIFRRVRPVTKELELGDELSPNTVRSKPYR